MLKVIKGFHKGFAKHFNDVVINPIQDGPFWGCSRMRRGQRGKLATPSLLKTKLF